MNNTIFWYWFKRISFITSICMLIYVIYTSISPEREFHTKYTNTKITQIIHIEGDNDIVKWSGVDKDGIKHDFEGKVFNKEGKVAWICKNCGHIHFGENAPEVCPVCAHPQAYFEIDVKNY